MTCAAVTVKIDPRGVATLWLSNPEKHNAFDDAMIADLLAAFDRLGKDDGVRLIVLAAEGKSFSAGADLSWMKRMAHFSYEDNIRDAQALAALFRQLNALPKPTIARVQGAAFGGAVGLVSCCDIAVASARASFALSEVKIGLVPATISPYVVAAIGAKAARRYFLTGERFDADTAQRLGLLNVVVADDSAMDEEINRFIELLLGNGSNAIRVSKQLIFTVANKDIDDELVRHTSEAIARARVSAEGQEGLSAFVGKRPAAWAKPAQQA